MFLKHQLQSIISGNGKVSNGEIIQTITGYLRRKKKAISIIEGSEFSKIEEEKILVEIKF